MYLLTLIRYIMSYCSLLLLIVVVDIMVKIRFITVEIKIHIASESNCEFVNFLRYLHEILCSKL